jgi:hypothetical protein
MTAARLVQHGFALLRVARTSATGTLLHPTSRRGNEIATKKVLIMGREK